jgi:hypothetical protein
MLPLNNINSTKVIIREIKRTGRTRNAQMRTRVGKMSFLSNGGNSPKKH